MTVTKDGEVVEMSDQLEKALKRTKEYIKSVKAKQIRKNRKKMESDFSTKDTKAGV